MRGRRIRLLVIDDHPVFRVGLASLVGTVPTMEIVGEGASATDAEELAERLQPDVILMDVRLRVGNGIEACRRILARRPESQILMLSSSSDEETVVASLLAGAAGYVTKDADGWKLIEAIETVADSGSVLDPAATAALLGWLRRKVTRASSDPLSGLTAQERNILPLISEGKTNREIATALSLSEHTVKTYISHVLQNMQMTRRSELAAFVSRLPQRPGT